MGAVQGPDMVIGNRRVAGESAATATAVGRERWPAYGAAMWALVFALRGVYWALGGTVGLGTLNQQLQERAVDGDPTVVTAMWAAVAMLLVASVLAVSLAHPQVLRLPHRLSAVGGARVPRSVLVAGGGLAAGILLAHGGSYMLAPLLGEGTTEELRWYGLLWGPWFVLGGALFLLAARRLAHRRLRGRRGGLLLVTSTAAGAVLILLQLAVAVVAGGATPAA